jgi:phosphoribosylcarboxyaminoimidazole (NCAIR) mutase
MAKKPVVAVIMGSDSDLAVMSEAVDIVGSSFAGRHRRVRKVRAR